MKRAVVLIYLLGLLCLTKFSSKNRALIAILN